MKKIFSILFFYALFTTTAGAWEAKVISILQHDTRVAVYLSPDPGPNGCSVGSPYLLVVEDTAAGKQRFSMLMTALATGATIGGYSDGCDSSIWGSSRPVIQRLYVSSN
jgi:hypothetical protein